MVFTHLALLCKKAVKSYARQKPKLLGELLIPSLCCMLLYLTIAWSSIEKVRSGSLTEMEFDRPELFRYETIIGYRMRRTETLNYKCLEKGPQCKESESAMRELCEDHYACFPFEMGARNGKYVHISSFNGTSLRANFTNSNATAPDPALKYSSEEFEIDRIVPYDFDRLHRFFGTVLYENAKKHNSTKDLYIRFMRHPHYKDWSNSVMFSSTDPTSRQIVYALLLLMPIFTCTNLISIVADERKSQIKDYLLTIGCSRASYHLHLVISAFIKNFVFCFASACIIFFPDWTFIGLFSATYFVYLLSCLNFAMLLTSFVHNPKMINDVCIIFVPMVFMMPTFIEVSRSHIGLALFSFINPGFAFFHSLDALRECSIKGGHLVWFDDFPYVLPLGVTLLMQLANAVVLLIAAIVVDHLVHTSFNPMKFIAKYKKVDADDEVGLRFTYHEKDQGIGKTAVIELKDVFKTYSTGVRAVRGATLDIYGGQITVLLGQNGAGKSTIFDIITGGTQRTSGFMNIEFPEEATFRKIALCPQYSPVFPKLTVVEHLHFFATLGGEKDWENKAEEFMKLLKLEKYAREYAETLSGGNRRKLCIAMALIGKADIILMDEPTAGVDTETRAIIKRFLAQKRGDKTILITTHYTDEAEDLADRVCIMAKGQIAATGSPSCLANNLGSGYDVTCVVKEKEQLTTAADTALTLARKYVTVDEVSMHGLEFCLSISNKDKKKLPEFIHELETRKEEMKIVDSGYKTSPLEKAFLKVALENGSTMERKKIKEAMDELEKEMENRATYWQKMWNSLKALVYKRCCFEWRNKFYQVFNCVLVVVMISVTNGFTNYVKPSKELNLLELNECARIGFVDVPELSERFREMARGSGECLVIEDIDDIETWQNETHLVRPPILGAVERKGPNYTMVVATNRRLYEPYFSNKMYEAITGHQFDFVLSYQRNPNLQLDAEMLGIVAKFMLTVLIVNSLGRLIRSYIIERSTGYAHLQALTGTHKAMYWLAHFLVDSLYFVLFYGYLMIVAYFMDYSVETLTHNMHLYFLCFIITVLKLAIIQRLFTSKNFAGQVVPVLLVISFIAFFGIYLALQGKQPKFSLEKSFPLYLDPFSAVVFYIVDKFPKPADLPSVYTVLAFQIGILLFLFSALENRQLLRFFHRALRRNREAPAVVDDAAEKLIDGEMAAGDLGDIEMQPLSQEDEEEMEEVGVDALPEGTEAEKIALEVGNIKKRFGKKQAVKGLTLAVGNKECFGLLGHNGAGKSTTFKVITGQAFADSGTATAGGVDCAKYAKIGYCPQDDALINQLTAYEHLFVLASLHGYANPDKVARLMLRCVGMEGDMHKIFKTLSGGQKRKVSLCCSLTANGPLMILDEPTTGIDPMVRNDIWSLIKNIRDKSETAIVLTSHSMAEVEALCSRVAVMVNGLIISQGTPQTLISRHGATIKLEFCLPDVMAANQLKDLVFERFPGSVFAKEVMRRFCFQIPRNHEDKLDFLKAFEGAYDVQRIIRENLGVEIDVTVVQSNLEDTFLALSEKSEEDSSEEPAMEENNIIMVA